jgi:hypothetical protein
MTARQGALGVCLLLTLSACMGGGRPPGPPPGGPESSLDRPQGPALFISPAGKPFRASSDGVEPRRAWFGEADRDADGALSREEMVLDALAFFTTLDLDRDDVLDGPEVTRYETVVVPEILRQLGMTGEASTASGPAGGGPRGGRPDGGRGGPPGRGPGGGDGGPAGGKGRGGPGGPGGGAAVQLQGAARFGLLNDPQPIMSADFDLSRRVTRAEYERKAGELFVELDRNGDGAIGFEELPPPRGRPNGRPPR